MRPFAASLDVSLEEEIDYTNEAIDVLVQAPW